MKITTFKLAAIVAVLLTTLSTSSARADKNLLNVSYDATRELYKSFNSAFARYWQATAHENVTIQQSHGGSGSQARAVMQGLDADVVTLALSYDIDAIQRTGLIKPGWQGRLKYNSTPYTSTIVFLVRKGNPKNIHTWYDLARPGVQVVTPNPKSSGGARWNYLAAWGFALTQPGGNDQKARELVSGIYHNVVVLDSGARGATNSFIQRHLGDVLIAWENEALEAVNKSAKGQVELVAPPVSILAEPSVAVVDANVDKHGTRAVATAYLNYLYSPEGQEIAAQSYYRPRNKQILKKYEAQFPKVKLFDISLFGGWDNAQRTHFADGGVFDQIYRR